MTTTEDFPAQHFIIYGTTGSGKTYYIKRWLKEKNMSFMVYTPETHYVEWKGSEKFIVRDNDFTKIDQVKNKVVILDDMESLTRHEQEVVNLFLQGRHRKLIGIIVAHSPKTINNQIRQNSARLVIMSTNTMEMFKHVKELYGITDSIELFKEEYGYIEYDIRKRIVKYFDKDNNDVTNKFLSEIEKLKVNNQSNRRKQGILNPRMLELIKFKDVEILSYPDEIKVKTLLEQEFTDLGHPLCIKMNCMIRYYLVLYYQYHKIPFNIEKFRHIISDYYAPWSYIKRWFLPALKLYKNPEQAAVEFLS